MEYKTIWETPSKERAEALRHAAPEAQDHEQVVRRSATGVEFELKDIILQPTWPRRPGNGFETSI